MRKASWKDIESIANCVLDQFIRQQQELEFELHLMPPVPIRDICHWRGLSVNAVSDLQHAGKKLAGMLDAEERAIAFRATDILGRQNFSVGHELGHYEMHWLPHQASVASPPLFSLEEFTDETFSRYFRCTAEDMGKFIDPEVVVRQDRNKTREVEANEFASFLLMPEELVRQWARQFQGDTEYLRRRLAYQFEVSEAAMEIRLKQLKLWENGDKQLPQKRFFDRLSHSLVQPVQSESPLAETDADTDATCSIFITPGSRLRTLISQLDDARQVSDRIIFDSSPFETVELGVIGPIQAVDLILLNDYIVERVFPLRTIATENLRVEAKLPAPNSYVSRHLSRLGVFDHWGLSSATELPVSLPLDRDTASGTRVLIRMARVEAGVDVETMAQCTVADTLEWAGQSASLPKFGDVIKRVVVNLAQNMVEHSGTRNGTGKGYIVAQLNRLLTNDEVAGYRAIVSVGDIGIGVRASLERQGLAFKTDLEALNRYIEGPTMSGLKTEITRDWHGYLQLDSGEATLNVGARSNSYQTGLYCIPGLQATIMLNCTV